MVQVQAPVINKLVVYWGFLQLAGLTILWASGNILAQIKL